MKKLLVLLILFMSCSEKPQADLSKENSKTDELKNCKLSFSIYGSPGDTRFTAMFNMNDKYGDTLMVSKCKKADDKDSCIYKFVYLNKVEQDSLYSFFQKIKSNFRLSEDDSHGYDGTKVLITISSGTNAVSYNYSGLSDVYHVDPEISLLVRFINKKLPKENQLY